LSRRIESHAVLRVQDELRHAAPGRRIVVRSLSSGIFFAAALADVASEQTLLFPAVGNLREMLALGSHRPLKPELAVYLAIVAREYNLARQLQDDWQREDPEAQLAILVSRAKTEFKAGAYLPAWRAAEECLKLKPNNEKERQLQQEVSMIKDQAREELKRALQERKKQGPRGAR
jgi:hypothetical protein